MEQQDILKGKNALVLMGSPRRNGATMKLLNCFMEAWTNSGGELTVINAYEAAIKPCIHCGYCKRNQGCVSPDFEPIDRSLKAADLLVIASPVYGLGFPSPLKAILDRTQQYFEAKRSLKIRQPIEKHKSALFLAATGSGDLRGVEMMREQLRLVCLLVNAALEHTLVASQTDRFPVNLEAIQAQMDQALLDIKEKMSSGGVVPENPRLEER